MTKTTTSPMQQTDIRRFSLNQVVNVNQEIATLAEQARDILGYSVLAKLPGVLAAEPAELTDLQRSLLELDIEILNNDDVRRYQREQMTTRTAELMAEWQQTYLTEKGRVNSYDYFRGPCWNTVKISEYHQPIPEFVLAKAVQIKQRYPECELMVQYLEDHPDLFLLVQIPDGREYHPPKEEYVVECWAEPKFEGRLGMQGIGGEGGTDTDSDIPF